MGFFYVARIYFVSDFVHSTTLVNFCACPTTVDHTLTMDKYLISRSVTESTAKVIHRSGILV